MQPEQTIITLFGAGLMSRQFVQSMVSRPENHVHICDYSLENAQRIAAEWPSQVTAHALNASDKEEVRAMVLLSSSTCVSLLPGQFHDTVAECCIEEGRNMTTASYVSPGINAMADRFKAKGLTFVGECGLDPGLDHIMTMKLVDECKQQGHDIINYQSWCGGLISPEHADNPVLYKFSWSPVGALKSLQNSAVYMETNKIVNVAASDLMYNNQPMQHINASLNLEGYPNRDSLKYKSLYGLDHCSTVRRGTLRYANFAFVMRSLLRLGLMQQNCTINCTSWAGVLDSLVQEGDQYNKNDVWKWNVRMGPEVDHKVLYKVLNRVFSHSHYQHDTKEQLIKKAQKLTESLVFFELCHRNHAYEYDGSKTVFDNLVAHLSKKLELRPGENDCVVLYTSVSYQEQGVYKTKALSMVKIGNNDYSAMAQTVSIPLATLTQCILDGRINRPGVSIPIHSDIYGPMLQSLEEQGIRFVARTF